MKSKRVLTYTKQSGGRDLIQVSTHHNQAASQKETSQKDEKTKVPTQYQKGEGYLSYHLICVISGGTTREKTFLTEINKKSTFKKIELIFISTPKGQGGLTPKMMLSEYHRITNDGYITMSGRNIKLDDLDEIYMFTDVDHYEDELREILVDTNEPHQSTPKWIISNPDFEIWIYYCFYNNPTQDLQEIINAVPSQRSSLLKTVNGRFNNGGGLDTRKAFEHLEEGIDHSKMHYHESNRIPSLLSTQMHYFAEDVLNKLGDEYTIWKKQRKEMRTLRRQLK